MIKNYVRFILFFSFIFLSACSVSSNVIEETEIILEQNFITTPYFSLEIPSDYMPSETENMAYNEETQTALGAIDISPLFPNSANEAFDELKALYLLERNIDSISESLTEFTAKDGTLFYTANLSYITEDNIHVNTQFLIVPSHNLIITLNIQSTNKDNADINLLNDMKNSIIFRDINSDILKESVLIDNRGAKLVLNSDNSFIYYQSSENMDNYFYGEYQTAFSNDGINLLCSLKTLENSYDTFRSIHNSQLENYIILYDDTVLSDDYLVCENDFYALTLYIKGSVLEEKEEKLDELVPYYGHYIPALNSFDFINLANGEGVLFVKSPT